MDRPLVRLSFVCLLTAALLLARTSFADEDDLRPRVAWPSLGVAGSLGALGGEAGVFADLGFLWDVPPRSKGRLEVSEGAAAAMAPTVLALPITPRVARSAVHASFRAARFLSEDSLDGMSARARWSGLMPDVRVGARRLWDDSARFDISTNETWRASDAIHANFAVEVRAGFRLDRLLFADEELGVARLRLAQSEAAQRLALRVVAQLAAWQRAWIETKAAPQGSVSGLEASLNLNELETTLDVLTGGWFASWRAREAR